MTARITPGFAAALLGAAAVVASAACGGGAHDPPFASVESTAQAAHRGPFGVGVATFTFVDASRPTAPSGDFPGSDDRTLEVEVWYPALAPPGGPGTRDAPPDHDGGPYPLIMLSHGFGATRLLYTSYGSHLASHGFVVAAPDFPLTSLDTPGGPRFGDLVNQPADVSFVIDRLLALSGDGRSPLAGVIDGERIGATGHSLGGATTVLLTYGALADPRIDAALAITPAGCPEEAFFAGSRRPLMVVEGQQDLIVTGARSVYERAPPPKYLVSIAGANHIRFTDIDLSDEVGLLLLAETLADRPEEEASGDLQGVGETGLPLEGCGRRPASPGEAAAEGETPLIDAERQRELLRTYATLFFAATLRDDESALAALTGGGGRHPEEVEYEFEGP